MHGETCFQMEYYYKTVDDPGKVNITTRSFYLKVKDHQCRKIQYDCNRCLSLSGFSKKTWKKVLNMEKKFLKDYPKYPDGYFNNGAINFIGD